jgi:D-hydroxyproline dehydrogenase subunit gamma
MSGKRVQQGVARGPAIHIRVNGASVSAFAGETLATALLAAGCSVFGESLRGVPKAPFCNMGQCLECLVWLTRRDGGRARVRACMTDIELEMQVETADSSASSCASPGPGSRGREP